MYSDRSRNWRKQRNSYYAWERQFRLQFTPQLVSPYSASGSTPPRSGNEVYYTGTPPRFSSGSGVYFQNIPSELRNEGDFGTTADGSGNEVFFVTNSNDQASAGARAAASMASNDRARLLAPPPDKPTLEDLYSKINWDRDLEEGEISPESLEPWDVEGMMELFRMQKSTSVSSSPGQPVPPGASPIAGSHAAAADAAAGNDSLLVLPRTPSSLEDVYSKVDWRIGQVPDYSRAWDVENMMDTYGMQRSTPSRGELLSQSLPATSVTWIQEPQHVSPICVPFPEYLQFNPQPSPNLVTVTPWNATFQPVPEPEPFTPQLYNPAVMPVYSPPNVVTYTCSPPNVGAVFTPSPMDHFVPPHTIYLASGHGEHPQHLINHSLAPRSAYRPPAMHAHNPNVSRSVVWAPTRAAPIRRAEYNPPVYFTSGHGGGRGSSQRGLRPYTHHKWHHSY